MQSALLSQDPVSLIRNSLIVLNHGLRRIQNPTGRNRDKPKNRQLQCRLPRPMAAGRPWHCRHKCKVAQEAFSGFKASRNNNLDICCGECPSYCFSTPKRNHHRIICWGSKKLLSRPEDPRGKHPPAGKRCGPRHRIRHRAGSARANNLRHNAGKR